MGLLEGQSPSSGVYPFGALGKALRSRLRALLSLGNALPAMKEDEAKTEMSESHIV